MSSNFHEPDRDQDLDLGGVPAEEGISTADAAERLDLDPEEQKNRTDPARGTDEDPETPPDREESIELDAPKYDEA